MCVRAQSSSKTQLHDSNFSIFHTPYAYSHQLERVIVIKIFKQLFLYPFRTKREHFRNIELGYGNYYPRIGKYCQYGEQSFILFKLCWLERIPVITMNDNRICNYSVLLVSTLPTQIQRQILYHIPPVLQGRSSNAYMKALI